MAVSLIIFGLVAVLLWLLSIRPYCRNHGKGFTPGATIGATFWVDWQEAGEIAKAKGDNKMIFICRIVLWLHLLGLVVFLYAIFKN